MYCPKCGSQMSDGDGFCRRCGTAASMSGGAVATALLERPSAITLLGWFDVLGGILLLLFALLMLAVGAAAPGEDRAVAVIAASFFATMGAATLAAGIGLLKLKSWGRILQIVLSCLGLPGFPLGTVVSGLILYYLFRPGVELLFSGRPAEHFTPAEIAEIAQARQSAAVIIAIVVVVVMLVVIALVGIVAAIAVPGLLRARQSGNEAAALGRVREIVNAENAYSLDNGGYFDVLDCLREPGRCLPHAAITNTFLATSATTDGAYVGTFYKGEPAPPPAGGGRTISPSSMASYAYVVVPATPGAGRRAFCGDSTGVVRWTNDDAAVSTVTNGQCPESWSPVR